MESLMFWQPNTNELEFMAADRIWSSKFPLECSGEESSLIRPLGFMESGLATAHTYGSSNIVYALRMHSRRPLCSSHVQTALTIIQGRIQNLRLCIRRMYGRRYLAEMTQARVLFETRHSDDWMQEYETQLQAVFDMERGPLWCAVLLTMPQTNSNASKTNSNTPHAHQQHHDDQQHHKDQQPPTHQHLSMLVLNFCHAISDGASNAVFCNMFLSILNNLIANQPVPIAVDIPLQAAVEEMPLLKAGGLTIRQLASTAGQIWSLAFPPVNQYLACFPTPPTPRQIRMRTYSLLMNSSETRRLLASCRKENVTVHATFTVAASIALRQIICECKPESQSKLLNIRSGHVVNFRRYLDVESRDAYGCYMGFFESNVLLDELSGDKQHFWQLAKITAAQMKRKLEEDRQPVTYCQLMQTFLSTERWVHRQHTKDMPHVSHYFGTSNMGNLDRLFDATGEHVEVTQLVRTTNIGHDLGMVFAHMFHTLRGRFMYNLDYLVSAVTEAQAQQYAEKTLYILKDMSSV